MKVLLSLGLARNHLFPFGPSFPATEHIPQLPTLSALGLCSPSCLCPWLAVSSQPCLDTPAVSCSFLPSPAGELAIFWDLITGSPRAFQPITGLLQAAGRVTAACGDEQQLPCMVAVPSGRPTLLGLLCIFPSKTCLIPILQDQIASGENTYSRRDDKRQRLCSQGGGQNAQQFLWGGACFQQLLEALYIR